MGCPDILPVAIPFPPSSNKRQQMVRFTVPSLSKEEGADSAIML